MTEIFKKYITLSNDFRKSNASVQSIENLYDFLYELQQKERNKEEDFILCNIYFLLGYYQSAYEIFEKIADKNNPKEVSKLYVWREKSISHKDNFFIKDVRKLKTKKAQPKLKRSDFQKYKTNSYQLKSKNIVIFNQSVSSEDFTITLNENINFDDFFDEILKYLNWLSDAKTPLIKFYNKNISPLTEQIADEDWYATLEVYSASLWVDSSGMIYGEIATGDQIDPDHILDISTENQKITKMSFDG